MIPIFLEIQIIIVYIVIHLEVKSSGNDLVHVSESSLKLNAAIDNLPNRYWMVV